MPQRPARPPPTRRARRAPERAPNRVRIIGGHHRGRVLRFPPIEGLRPTPDRVRETLFNWLGQDLTGTRCLDLFAGSGALGFEAASRGAKEVVMVERSRVVCAGLKDTAAMLGDAGVRIVCGDALEFAARAGERFDIVFVDPPYGSGLVEQALALLPPRLAPGARVYLESDSPFAGNVRWRVAKQSKAGAVHFHLLELAEP